MALKFSPLSALKFVSGRSFSAQAATKAVQTQHQRIPSEELKTTTLENGLTIHSIENQSPVSRIVIVTKAGSRYEDGTNLGLCHTLRNAAGLTTLNSTTFAITKNIEWVGANIYASATRDHMIYTLECNRDYVANAVRFLNDIVFEPSFKHWELEDALPRIQLDLECYQQNQGAQLIEALHRASFRGGLANSLFMDPARIGKIKSEQLLRFTKDHITGPRTVISAVGVDHERLVHVYKKLTKIRSTSVDESKPSKFNAHGGEVRVEHAAPSTMLALAMESSGLANPKDSLKMEIMKHILGMSKSRVPFTELQATRLGKAVLAAKPQNPFSIGSFTADYADLGLFGIAIAAEHKDISRAAKAAISVVRDIGKGNINNADLEAAKLKVTYALGKRVSKHTKTAMKTAVQQLTQGTPQSFDDTVKIIDSISMDDVTTLAQKMSRSKPSMAVVGKLYEAPHLDELLQ